MRGFERFDPGMDSMFYYTGFTLVPLYAYLFIDIQLLLDRTDAFMVLLIFLIFVVLREGKCHSQNDFGLLLVNQLTIQYNIRTIFIFKVCVVL